jgi:hypothetical protein
MWVLRRIADAIEVYRDRQASPFEAGDDVGSCGCLCDDGSGGGCAHGKHCEGPCCPGNP